MSYESEYTKIGDLKCEPNNFKYGKQQNEIKEGWRQPDYARFDELEREREWLELFGFNRPLGYYVRSDES